MKKQVLISERQNMTRKALLFMEITVIPVWEHDNSVCLSGNKDVRLDVKVHTQEKLLNCYIYILHEKQQHRDHFDGFISNFYFHIDIYKLLCDFRCYQRLFIYESLFFQKRKNIKGVI